MNDPDLLCEPAGSGPIATGSVKKYADFWRTFVKSSWVLSWIEKGYELQWIDKPPAQRITKNSASALAHASFVSSAVYEMFAAGAISIMPKGERPEVVSPLGVFPKGTEGMFRLIINMCYVIEHLVKQKFKFEGLKDLANMAEKGDHAVSFDLTSGYYHVGLHPRTRSSRGSSGRAAITSFSALPLGWPQLRGSSRR